MAELPAQSIDLVLCDPPYGTTACAWDSVIPFEPMWEQIGRVAKPQAAIILTASQPFTTKLIDSNIANYRASWVWDKGVAANFTQAKFHPLRVHEDVVVFGNGAGKITYNPRMTLKDRPEKLTSGRNNAKSGSANLRTAKPSHDGKVYTHSYPTTIQKFSVRAKGQRGLHPTQKPVALMEYLIRTYSNEGETVLDFTMGSGTTGVAAQLAGRGFVGIELDRKYYDIAETRILGDGHHSAKTLIERLCA